MPPLHCFSSAGCSHRAPCSPGMGAAPGVPCRAVPCRRVRLTALSAHGAAAPRPPKEERGKRGLREQERRGRAKSEGEKKEGRRDRGRRERGKRKRRGAGTPPQLANELYASISSRKNFRQTCTQSPTPVQTNWTIWRDGHQYS